MRTIGACWAKADVAKIEMAAIEAMSKRGSHDVGLSIALFLQGGCGD
jgi:hypothetical protein